MPENERGEGTGPGVTAEDFELAEDRPVPGPWYANVDDEIGGYSVCNADKVPSTLDPYRGERVVANCTRRADAQLIAFLRNLADVDLRRQVEEREATTKDKGRS